jgi:hypothetical protein
MTAIVAAPHKGATRFRWKTIRARSIFVCSDHNLLQTNKGHEMEPDGIASNSNSCVVVCSKRNRNRSDSFGRFANDEECAPSELARQFRSVVR